MAKETMTEKSATQPAIEWDFGTAYELFISLHVLQQPDYFGIRASWAAGVRSRIPAAERKLLEEIQPLTSVPLKWIHNLPAPKDAISALRALKQIPAAERMIRLQGLDEPCQCKTPEEHEKHKQHAETMLRIASERAWKKEDVDYLLKAIDKKHNPIKREAMERALNWWSRPDELGEGYFSALQSYHQAFFEEDEKRVAPILKAGLERAQELSTSMNTEELFVELSQGVQMGDEFRTPRIVMAPAFWNTPLVFFERLDKERMLLLFGARPATISALPGESLPDGLVRALKALADPTRLKILFYLSHESLTPSELARRLHLRAPTVTHHLSELRLASLVYLTLEHDERRYAIRTQTLEATFGNLNSFLQGKTMEETDEKR